MAQSCSRDTYPIVLSKSSSFRSTSSPPRRCRLVSRLIRKSGRPSIYQKPFPQRLYRLLHDLSNTLINSHWNWTLLALTSAFVATWLVFACLWMVVALANGDLDRNNVTAEPCLSGIQGFAGYFLFSVETQSTIGYGGRVINSYCPEGIILLCVQMAAGAGICGSVVSIVYAKMVGPHRQHSMNCFSRNATICQRDGGLCLMFRVRDHVGKYTCHTAISAFLVKKRQGELLLRSLKLEPIGLLIWPIEVVHKLDSSSPFWDLSAKDLITKKFEIVVIMEGSSSSTSYMSRTTTSYLTKEVLWGHRFRPCLRYNIEEQCFEVDHKQFNKTEEILTPLCSSKRLQEVFEEVGVMSPLELSATNSPVAMNLESFSFDSPGVSSAHSPEDDSRKEDDEDDDDKNGLDCEGFCAHRKSLPGDHKDLVGFEDLFASLEHFSIENLKEKQKVQETDF